MLLFFNIMILAIFCGQVYMSCDQLDSAITIRSKITCYTRIVVSGVLAGIALLLLYKVYGVTDDNLLHYLAYGRV